MGASKSERLIYLDGAPTYEAFARHSLSRAGLAPHLVEALVASAVPFSADFAWVEDGVVSRGPNKGRRRQKNIATGQTRVHPDETDEGRTRRERPNEINPPEQLSSPPAREVPRGVNLYDPIDRLMLADRSEEEGRTIEAAEHRRFAELLQRFPTARAGAYHAHEFQPDQAFWGARREGKIPVRVKVYKDGQTGQWRAKVTGRSVEQIHERMQAVSKASEEHRARMAERSRQSQPRTSCRTCGHRATGRYGDVLYRSGECRDCFQERKSGY